MTISSLTNRVDYLGSGITGPYSYPFRIQAATDLVVTKANATGVSTTLTYLTDYTVSGVGARNGGAITLTAVLSSAYALTIRRSVPLRQLTNIRNQGPYLPETIEDALDRLTMMAQQLDEVDSRMVTLPVAANPAVVSAVLPLPVANQALFWNMTATALESRVLGNSDNVALPGAGRVTPSLTAYLANNAIYNAVDYGALGNGVFDSTTAFQDAAAALPARGATFRVPAGRYRVYDTVDIPGDLAGTDDDGCATKVELDPGAIVEFWCPTTGTPLFRFNERTNQAGGFHFNGGRLDGANAADGCCGLEIHVPNVNAEGTRITHFTGSGAGAIRYVYDGIVPPICCSVVRCQLHLNQRGIISDGAQTAQLVVLYNRIEDNFEEGIYANDASKLCICYNTIENNGFLDRANIGLPVWPVGPFYPPQTYIANRGEVIYHGNYHESFPGQIHNHLTIEGVAQGALAIDIRNNRFVSYGGTCISVGMNGGVADAISIGGGNAFFSTSLADTVGIQIGPFVRGYTIADCWFDNSFDGTNVARRYEINANAIGTLHDQNRFTDGHTVTFQNTDIIAEDLTVRGEGVIGDSRTAKATGATGRYRPFRVTGRVTSGAQVIADIVSTIGNTATLNVLAGSLPIFPTVALAGAGAGNVNNGLHFYKVTFVDAGGETEGGLASASITVVDKTSDGQVALTGVAVGNSPTTARNIYRTKANVASTGPYYLAGTVAGNATTTFTDNVADSGLGAALPAVGTAVDLGLILSKLAAGPGTVGTVDNTVLRFIANNIEQGRFTPSTGFLDARLGYSVAGTQVLAIRQAAVPDVATADATDLATAIALVNALKASHNTLLSRLRSTTGHGLFA